MLNAQRLALFRPFRQAGKDIFLALIGECDAAREQLGRRYVVPGAVFVISHQRKAPAGKLNPDLVTSAGVQADAHQRSFTAF